MKKIIPVLAVILIFAACKKSSAPFPVSDESSTAASITDVNEAAKYTSIKIGTQRWMTKNLETSSYRNGNKIPQVKNNAKWAALTTGAWCWYKNDSATYAATYGKLYNWYAVNDPRGLAPTGWHVPSDAEWTTLSTFLGNNAGGKLKETGTTHWLSPNTGATNKSGFTGLPGGLRYNDGTFANVGGLGFWWSSTEAATNVAWFRDLFSSSGDMGMGYSDKIGGSSVRCLRD